MTAFTKKSVDKYIRTRIMYWIYDLGRNAPKYLNDNLGLSGEEEPTEEDSEKIKIFQQRVRDSTIVTGGCFTSMLFGEEPNDLDIYLKDKEVATLISWFYINKMLETGNLKENSHVHQIDVNDSTDGVSILIRSQGITGDGIDSDKYKYFEMYPEAVTDEFFKQYRSNVKDAVLETGKHYHVSFMTSNAITLNNGLQIIIRFCGDPTTIHSNFDFIHATNYWTWEESVVYNQEALASTLEKRLRYFGSKFPVATIFRMKKFIERGWRISAGEIVKILYDVSKLDLDNVSVLREQSMGCDSAYFSQVIELLHSRRATNDQLDRTYLFQAIEIAFDMHDPKDNFLEASGNSEENAQIADSDTLLSE